MTDIRQRKITAKEIPGLKGKPVRVSKTCFSQSSRKARRELNLVVVDLNLGRPPKYTDKQVQALLKDTKVMGVAEAAAKHEFPLRTAYWYYHRSDGGKKEKGGKE